MQWLTEENTYLSIKGHYHTCLDPLIFTEEERGGGCTLFFQREFFKFEFPWEGKGSKPPKIHTCTYALGLLLLSK